jgi:hypothetical protein
MEAAMNLKNILDNTFRTLLVAIGLLIGSLPAQASVTYKYSAQTSLGELDTGFGSHVQTAPGLLQGSAVHPLGPLADIGSPITASFSFAAPLPLSSTIPVHLESGGYNFLGATQGGLQSYSTDFVTSLLVPITSDINTYAAGSVGNVDLYHRYSALDGQVTTDASGNISAWNLQFTLYDDGNGGGIRIDKDTNPPTPKDENGNSFGFQPDALLHISSDSASFQQIQNVVSLNGTSHSGSYSFDGADWIQENPGGSQHFRYYTDQPGSIVLVPEPETWAMMIAGLGLLGWRMRGLRK